MPKLRLDQAPAASAAQVANHLALAWDRAGVAETFCIAGVGGGVTGLVCIAQSGQLMLSDFGVKKRKHADFDPAEAQRIHELHTLPAARALVGRSA